ncbi:MAG: adenosylcobalamin-dependent ribonucleoside-diphosphate reductase, partial [Patescibacteria group bacterium]
KAMFEAGNPGGTGQLSSCFVLPVEDDIDSIFKTLGQAAVVHKNNGGTGFNFSHIRPHGDKVRNVPGASSGPVDFLAAYSAALSKILQGAKRRGANIGILNADHPDIEDFIRLKDEDGTVKNFNISVGVTDEFMNAVKNDKMWNLINPRTKEVVRRVKAKKLFRTIVEHACATGDPGLMFLDTFNRDNPTPQIGRIESTNPCGEIGLLPYESCNLTSICLQNHLHDGKIDWEDLEKSIRLGVRFLDDMIEVNTYALPEIEQMVKNGNRRIGLGVMGFSHMLVKLGVQYNSDQAVELSEKLAKFIRTTAEDESSKLAKERGSFPNWDRSIYFDKKPMRNCATTMIAPTGTISMLADTTSGIEPIFSLVTKRRTFFEDDKRNKPTKELYMVD